MKKKLLLAMFTIATVFSLVACGGDKETASKKEDTKKEESKKDDKDDDKKKPSNEDKDISDLIGALTGKDKVTPEPEPTEAPDPTEAPNATEAPEPTTAPEATEAPEPTDTPEPTKTPSTGTEPVTTDGFTEVVDSMISTDQFGFQIVGVEKTERDKLLFHVILENNSDVKIRCGMENTYVNSLFFDPMWYEYIEPGETKESAISFRHSDIDKVDIGDITSFHFELSVTNNDDWSADPFVEDSFVYFPQGKDAAVAFDYTVAEDDIVFINNNDVTVALIDNGFNDYSDYSMLFYLENNSDTELRFDISSMAVNDIMSNGMLFCTLLPGMKTVYEVSTYSGDLETAGVTDITKIEFPLEIIDTINWTAEPMFDEVLFWYPYGKDAAVSNLRTPQDSDVLVFDKPECKLYLVDSELNNVFYNAVLYFENKLPEEMLSISIENTLINDTPVDVQFNFVLADAGKGCYYTLYWNLSDLTDAGIADITSLQLPVVVEGSSWPATEYVNETFTVNP